MNETRNKKQETRRDGLFIVIKNIL